MVQPKITGIQHGIPRMLYASDGSNWYAILVDSDGHVKIDVVAYPGSNALGNFPFGYYDVYGENKEKTTTNGNVTIDGSVVPAGEVWIVTNITGWHNDAAARVCLLRAIIGGTVIDIASNRALAQYTWLDKQGMWVLKAGDYMRVVAEALATGCKGFAGFSGYKMKVS